MSVVPLTKKRKLAERVVMDGYYADGVDLYEIVGVGATGCVTVRSVRTEIERCFDIVEFRKHLWLVQQRG